ncbi:putative microtubule-associated serine/threonine-protein kinase 3-like [Homarus americanus]|uniref:Putative microtubule-associated serine/threonine-protein kinase 3-like n=1 Tax=Homarus americanus TaxID=6706 RepID=A0A8J5MYE3_HOMAM|nr:putative microtubule-associated serine/threonine-protein kinase 3-like [Homarus americanus]
MLTPSRSFQSLNRSVSSQDSIPSSPTRCKSPHSPPTSRLFSPSVEQVQSPLNSSGSSSPTSSVPNSPAGSSTLHQRPSSLHVVNHKVTNVKSYPTKKCLGRPKSAEPGSPLLRRALSPDRLHPRSAEAKGTATISPLATPSPKLANNPPRLTITSQSAPNYETPSVVRSVAPTLLTQRFSSAVSLPPTLPSGTLEEAPEELDSPERQEAARANFCEGPQGGRGSLPGTNNACCGGVGVSGSSCCKEKSQQGIPIPSGQGSCQMVERRGSKDHAEGREKARSDSRGRRDSRDLRREDSKRESRRTAQEKRELFKAGKEKEGTS